MSTSGGSSASSGGSSSAAGVVLLLFTAYQIWGTSIQESHTQAALRTQLQQETNSQEIRHALAEEAALDKLPTGPPVAAPRTADPAEGEPVGDIRIPVIGINQVVVEGTNTPDLRKGPGHYIGTPLPGQAGNAAIAGHRTTYGHPFYNLDAVKVGDPIVLTTLQGIFVYDATRSQVVSPSDTSVLDNVFADTLTLTTCNPRFSASTRLVVGQAGPLPAVPRIRACTPATTHTDPKSERPGRELQRRAHRRVVLGVRGRRGRRRHPLAGLPLPAPALGHLRGRAPSACWSCSASSSAPSARCCPPASDGRARSSSRCPNSSGASPPWSSATGAPPTPPSAAAWPTTPTSLALLAGPRCPSAAPPPPGRRALPPPGRAPTTRWRRTTTRWPTARHGRSSRPRRRGRRRSPTSAARTGRGWRELIATRTTQTNEVGRCTALAARPLPRRRPARRAEPLSLLDLGTSAGLNLLFDDYAYTYRPPTATASRTAGPRGLGRRPRVQVRATTSSPARARLPPWPTGWASTAPPSTPSPTTRARWLLACQWPDNPARFGRLRAALANVRAAPTRPGSCAATWSTDLARGGRRRCPATARWSCSTPGWPPTSTEDAARTWSRRPRPRATRPVHYLYAESPFETPGLPTPPSPVPREGPRPGHRPGPRRRRAAPPVRLADMHPHGCWIRWWPGCTVGPQRSGPHGASRRAGTCTPSSVTMAAEPTALRPKRLRMASTAAVTSCQDCSRAVALWLLLVAAVPEVEGRAGPPPPALRPRHADPEQPDALAGVDAGQRAPAATCPMAPPVAMGRPRVCERVCSERSRT